MQGQQVGSLLIQQAVSKCGLKFILDTIQRRWYSGVQVLVQESQIEPLAEAASA